SLPPEIQDVRVRSGWDDDTETVFQGRVSADRDLSMEWDLIEQRITSRLERVPGVAQINFEGIEPPRVRVDLDVRALRRHRIGADRVAAAIEAANAGLALGVIRGPQLRFDVRDDSRPDSAEQIAALPIPGTTFRVGDLAKVTFRSPRLDYGRTLDRRPAIGFDVFKDSQANTVAVVDGVRAEIERINADPYLQGMSVLAFLDQGEEIRLSLKGLLKSGIFGGLLAVVVLMAFLRRLSVTIVLAVAIPFSLIVACGALYLLGRELDILTLTGLMLGVGMLVDNAVVVVENIHRLEQKGVAAREAARRGAGNVSLAVTAATATTILVWSWLAFTDPGELRTYAMPVAITISLTVFCSLIISLTFIPLVAARYLSSREVPAGMFERRLIPAYRRVLEWSLRHRLITLFALLLLATSAIWPFRQLEFSSEPKEAPRWVTISYQFDGAATLERMKDVIDRVEEEMTPVVETPEVTNIYSYYSERRGWALTRLYLERGHATEAYAAELREKVRPLLPTVPGVRISTREPNFWRHFYGGGGKERNVQLAFRGTEPETVGLVVSDVRDFLEREIPEAKEVISPDRGGRQEARVVIDPDRVRSAGTTPDAISRAVGSMFRGRMLSRLHTERGERDVFITVPESEDQGLSDVNDLEVPLVAGGTVPLDAIADIELAKTPESIRRENQRVTSWIMVTLPETMTTPEARALVTERMALYDLPSGI
ncbi:MAG: efflux RND transporter permease subunit, partial [Acidobacteriota bacterium]|nr:efflux RND transporter permease subunit [Acidobacteriota bacterium]